MRIIHILAWPAAIAILCAIIVTELLPLAFGTRFNLQSDSLSLIYVALHFIINPIASLIHIVWNIFGSIVANFVLRRPDFTWKAHDVLSTAITISYVTIMLLWPYPFILYLK
jgi:hypothetical protein